MNTLLSIVIGILTVGFCSIIPIVIIMNNRLKSTKAELNNAKNEIRNYQKLETTEAKRNESKFANLLGKQIDIYGSVISTTVDTEHNLIILEIEDDSNQYFKISSKMTNKF